MAAVSVEVLLWGQVASSATETVSTSEIVPSSVTYSAGRWAFWFSSPAAVGGLIETEDGTRTFSTSDYRYGDEWQLVRERTCTTIVLPSPIVLDADEEDVRCVERTIAVLGGEIPAG